MNALIVRLALLAALLGAAQAAPLSQNLGQGLTFYRVHHLPADLPGADEPRRPCVLDLRYVAGDADAAAVLAAWLKFHATARAPVFVLANASTSAALVSVITPRGAGASVVVFGAATPDFAPDIAVKTSAEAERNVYDALEHGASAGSLISENPDKPRNDEAKLARERQPEGAAVPEVSDTVVPDTLPETAKPKPNAPLVDAVLQRAVQTYRALVALKKL